MLWRYSGKQWIDVAEAHRNSATGLDAYLVCPGPSLADVDVDALARRGEPAVEAWARSVVAGGHRGDQEALDAIRETIEPRTVELPRRYQRLRLDGAPCPDDVIYHWTGPAGKQAIRQIGSAGTADKVKEVFTA